VEPAVTETPPEETPQAGKEAVEPAKTAEPAPDTTAAPSAVAKLVPSAPTEKPLTKLATPHQAMLKPSAPLVVPPAIAPMADLGHRPAKSAPSETVSRHAPPSRPLTQPHQEASRRYVVQMGVFNNLANAEELRAKLELNGIPAQIEARVQVGPFSSKEQADDARRKLTALGLEPGLLMAIRK
jgi:DedD protein